MNTPGDDMRDDELAGRLRRALQAEAAAVHPAGDGLARIRAGIEARGAHAWWRSPALALAAAAVVGVLAGGLAVGLSRDGDRSTVPLPPAGSTSPATGTPSKSESPTSPSPTESSPSETQTSSTPPARTIDVFVYYLRNVEGAGPRLFREEHRAVEHADGAIATAVVEMFGDRAADPDYTSLWPSDTRVLGVTRSGDTAIVDLSQAATQASAGGQFEELSLQQLVYTVTATDNSVRQVRLLVNGQAVDTLWGHVSVGRRAMARADDLDVRGLQWILAPRQGETVGSPVTVEVNGTGFEGQINLKVFRGATEVASDFVTTEMGVLRDGHTTFDLPAGTYTVRAYDEYGENMRLREWDSKRFTVE